MIILKMFEDWRRRPISLIEDTLPELRDLSKDLTEIRNLQPLTGIVMFFNLVSCWHDRCDEINQIIGDLRRVDYGQHTKLIEKLGVLIHHFENAGRSRYGYNRTEKGQEVTGEHVFLGGIYGVWTLNILSWLKHKNDRRDIASFSGFHLSMANMNSYDVVSQQARDFMTPHIESICELIDWIGNHVARRSAA